MKRTSLFTLALASLLAASACAGPEQLAKSMQETRLETARTSEQLKATLTALNALTKQKKGDLRPAYNVFSAEAGRTEAAAAQTSSRVQWMGGEGRRYFQDWQKNISSIANESLRKKAQKRLNTVQASYDKVEAALKEAGEKFKPFLSDLKDVKTTLATDVTAGGVKAVRRDRKSANWDHQFVHQAVNSALKEMGKMEKALSSEAG